MMEWINSHIIISPFLNFNSITLCSAEAQIGLSEGMKVHARRILSSSLEVTVSHWLILLGLN